MKLRPGMGHLLIGIVLLAVGVIVTARTTMRWYGALIVGVIEIARGVYTLLRPPRQGD